MNEHLVLKIGLKYFSYSGKVRTMKIGLFYFIITFGLRTIKSQLKTWENCINSPHAVYISE